MSKRKQTCLGLFRGVGSELGIGVKKNEMPYVFTNPPPNTELYVCDKVFVLSCELPKTPDNTHMFREVGRDIRDILKASGKTSDMLKRQMMRTASGFTDSSAVKQGGGADGDADGGAQDRGAEDRLAVIESAGLLPSDGSGGGGGAEEDEPPPPRVKFA